MLVLVVSGRSLRIPELASPLAGEGPGVAPALEYLNEMCGIAGFARTSAWDASAETLSRMAASMAHRGPDDEGTVLLDGHHGSVGLCARRLAIQDLSSAGHQPMRSRSGNVIAFNGEVFNVKRLRRELIRLGSVFRGSSDTEVVLQAYNQWGPGCIEHLRGMFALAVWDERERSLLLARDRMGIKPLYRAQVGDGLAFASELRTLVLGGFVAPELSPAGVLSFLRLGAVQEPYTIVDGVSEVPPGHFEIWRDGCLSTHEYWSLEAVFRRPRAGFSRAGAVEVIREKLEDAIETHLVSDVPLGVFLSGGIDSTALVALVTRVAEEPPRTVSVVFPEREYTEDRYIEEISEHYRTQHTSIHLDAQAVIDYVPQALEAMDQPTIDGVNTFIVSSVARSSGLTVALSGVGGDELFGGYDTFRLAPRLVAIQRRVPSTIRLLAARLLDLAGQNGDRHEKLKQWLRGNDLGLQAAYALRRELFGSVVATHLHSGSNDASDSLPGICVPGGLPDELNSLSYYELAVYMRNMLLRDTDVMSMASSLEVRVPLLDHELVELVAGMPGEWKGGTSPPKPLLVDALRDLIPAGVYQRKKIGFTLPYEHWLRGPLRGKVEDVLLDDSFGGTASVLLDGVKVRDIWERFCGGKTYWTRPWALFVLKSWGESQRALFATDPVR